MPLSYDLCFTLSFVCHRIINKFDEEGIEIHASVAKLFLENQKAPHSH